MTQKALSITLSDGRVVTVRELKMGDLSVFLKCMPAIKKIRDVSTFAGGDNGGVIIPPPDIPENLLEPLYTLLAQVADISAEDIANLSMVDGFGLISALGELVPSNFMTAGGPQGKK